MTSTSTTPDSRKRRLDRWLAAVGVAIALGAAGGLAGCGGSNAGAQTAATHSQLGKTRGRPALAWTKAYPTSNQRALRLLVANGPCFLPVRGARLRERSDEITVTLYGPRQRAHTACLESISTACVKVALETPVHGRQIVDGAPRRAKPGPIPGSTVPRLLRRCKPLGS